MADRKIQPIEAVQSNSPGSRLWDKWAAELQKLEVELETKDPFESSAHKKISLLALHMTTLYQRTDALRISQELTDELIVKVKKAYTPGAKQITPLVISIFGHLAGGLAGLAPVAFGLTGNKASGFNAASQMSQGVLGGGGQGVSSLMSTSQQGEQSVSSSSVEDSKRILNDRDSAKQHNLQAQIREQEAQRELGRKKGEVWAQMTS